ncbi:hypothetical protein [Flavobacterium sp. FlaQc-28]|uniref:hypothetical protein n=1 Tax=Flavobacterium sp. FlaQc-28 TaxID=3374178 RepID=UPI0037576EBE
MKNEKTIVLEELIRSLDLEKDLIPMEEADKEAIISKIEDDVEKYRINNFKRVIESQEEIANFVLTS